MVAPPRRLPAFAACLTGFLAVVLARVAGLGWADTAATLAASAVVAYALARLLSRRAG